MIVIDDEPAEEAEGAAAKNVLNPNFKDMLSAFSAAGVEYLAEMCLAGLHVVAICLTA